MSEQNKKMKTCDACGESIAKGAKVCPHCGKKNKKPIYKRGWFIALIVIVVICAAASAGKGDNESTSVTENTVNASTEAKPVEYVVYDVSELIDDLESNALKAETKYNNQYVEITGKLDVIDSDGKYISLEPSDSYFSLISVQCYIKNDTQKAQVAEMSKGDIVTLKGKITSVGEIMGYSLNIDSIN